jgi:antitoxin component YwqK of YwqJK toxin-antitoxin module
MVRLLLYLLLQATCFNLFSQDLSEAPSGAFLLKRAPGQLYATVEIARDGNITGSLGNQVIFQTQIKKEKIDGHWKSWHSNGVLLDSGRLKKGIPHSTWKVWDSLGNLTAIRHYDADLFFRIRDEIELNHPRFQHTVLAVRYKREGNAVLNYFRVSHSFPDAVVPTVSTLEKWVLQNQTNLSNYHPVYLECLHHGFYLNKSSEGIVTDSGYYKNGLREGVWTHRDARKGITEKGLYHQGYRKKEWKEYNSKGRLTAISYYNHGRLIWRKER